MVAWVNRCTFFLLLLLLLLLPTSNFLFLLNIENAVGGMGHWQCRPSCFLKNFYFADWPLKRHFSVCGLSVVRVYVYIGLTAAIVVLV